MNLNFVYIIYAARAAFASCPSSYDGCSNPENITVMEGEDINFNSSVVYIPGGSCGFEQEIERILLKRCANNSYTSDHEPGWLSSISFVPNQVINTNPRVSVNPERDLFILSNSTLDDSGLYQVVVIGIHPNHSRTPIPINKRFWVSVNQGEHACQIIHGRFQVIYSPRM